MGIHRVRRGTVTVALFVALTALFLGGSQAALADSGISSSKGCNPTTVPIGTTIACHYSFSNNGASSAAGNTVTLSSIVDTVHAAPSDDVSGNLLDLTGATLTKTGGATCNGSVCTLPPGASITTPDIAFHTATAGDYAKNVDHHISDQAELGWTDLCNVTSAGCNTGAESTTDSAQVTIVQVPSNTVTAIKQGGATVTSVLAGSSVTDQVTVTGSAGTPTGAVTFTFYTSSDCTTGGTVLTPDSTLNGSGVATSASQGPLAAGSYSFKATYHGDGIYSSSTGACEPLTVTSPSTANLTPGFWKNHEAATKALLPLHLGNYNVDTFAKAQQVLSGMGCGKEGALNCMAGMLLAAELNLAQGGGTCINPVVAQANQLLIANLYNGPGTVYKLSPADQALAMSLHDKLSAYNVDAVVNTC